MSSEILEENEVSTEPPVEDVVETRDPDDASLEETQRIRMKLIGVMDGVDKIHEDSKMVGSLIKLLDGVDKQVLGKRRIKAQEGGNKATSDMAKAINDAIRQNGSRMVRVDSSEQPTDYRPPKPNLPQFDVDPGELSPVGEAINVEEIIAASYGTKVKSEED